MVVARTVSRTSCTRTICAPCRTATAAAASVPSRRSCGGSRDAPARNDFREGPTRRGRPSTAKRRSPASSRKLSAPVFPKPMPGSTIICFTPCEVPLRTASCSREMISAKRSSYTGSACIVFGVPLMCMTTAEAPPAATTSGIAGSKVKPLMSLTITAPAAREARATEDLVVSIETGTSVRFTISSITGRTRSSSSCAPTGSDPSP